MELTGPRDKLDDFIEALAVRHVIEVVRSGVLGICRRAASALEGLTRSSPA